MMTEDPDSEVFLEMQRVGNALEVRAVSGFDGFEVSFVAPADGSQAEIERVARAKLSYARRKRAAPGEGGGKNGGGDPAGGRGGLLA